ncbi:MAG: hypothetical protein KJO24_05645, partial [Gammaproteobacteria bacterium]|nr:hypothetical protein [Gammaproteobacteria bacterium]
GWHGMENLALIPGTVGAAPMQNIGAYGVEVAQFIESVQFVALPGYKSANQLDCQADDEPALARALQNAQALPGAQAPQYSLSAKHCQFGYRDSIFKHALRDRVMVTTVTFKLDLHFKPQLDYPALQGYLRQHNKTSSPGARELVDAVIAIRRAKLPDPADIANAGSFFKNPVVDQAVFSRFIAAHPQAPYFSVGKNSDSAKSQARHYKIPAGWLIEQCGFKGRDCGNVGMHAAQALVLVNRAAGHVVAAEVLAFAEQVAAAVQQRFGLQLEIEPRRYGC